MDGANVDYKSKYEQSQQAIKDNYANFEVPYYGTDNDDYVNGVGFCCDNKVLKAGVIGNGNDNPELFQYYYHSDHLGSSSLITNLDGEVVQHIEYVPFGEVFIEERNNTWNTPYLFNAKELDEETGNYYFGKRYYDPRTSVWLSTDLLQEKYPNVSTYAYCAQNPVKYIDPDGRDIVITGIKNTEATEELQKSVASELKITRNAETNKISYEKLSKESLSDKAQKLVDAIDNSNIVVNILANDTYVTSNGDPFFGGAFMGGIYYNNTVTANQEVNPIVLGKMDKHFENPGASMLHGVLEAYIAGVDALEKKRGYSDSKNDYQHYKQFHDEISKIAPQSGSLFSSYYAYNGTIMHDIPLIGGREDIWVQNKDGSSTVLHSRSIKPLSTLIMETRIKPIIRNRSLKGSR